MTTINRRHLQEYLTFYYQYMPKIIEANRRKKVTIQQKGTVTVK